MAKVRVGDRVRVRVRVRVRARARARARVRVKVRVHVHGGTVVQADEQLGLLHVLQQARASVAAPRHGQLAGMYDRALYWTPAANDAAIRRDDDVTID